jgi:hypothetical protein
MHGTRMKWLCLLAAICFVGCGSDETTENKPRSKPKVQRIARPKGVKPKAEPKAPTPPDAPAPDPEKKLAAADAFAMDHPKSYARAVELYKEAGELGKGTLVEARAARRRRRLEDEWRKKATALLAELRKDAEAKQKVDDFDGALHVLELLPDGMRSPVENYHQEVLQTVRKAATDRIARILADAKRLVAVSNEQGARAAIAVLRRIRFTEGKDDVARGVTAIEIQIASVKDNARRAASGEAERRANEQRATAALDGLLSEFERSLQEGDFGGAVRRLDAAAARSTPAGKVVLTAAAGVASLLGERKALVRTSFKVGAKQSILTTAGNRSGVIAAVTNEGIELNTPIMVRGRKVGESRLKLAWSKLAPREVAKRTTTWQPQGDNAPLARAYLAWLSDDAEGMRRALTGAPAHPLADRLNGRLNQKRNARAEAEARDAWRVIRRDVSAKTLTPVRARQFQGQIDRFQAKHGNSTFAQGEATGIKALREKLNAATQVNYAVNPGFEGRALAPWTYTRNPGAKIERLTEKPRGGAACLALSPVGADAPQDYHVSQTVRVTARQFMVFSAWGRVPAGAGRAAISMQVTDGGKKLCWVEGERHGSDSWTKYTAIFRATSGRATIELGWVGEKTGNLVAGMFDDVTVRPLLSRTEALAGAARHEGHAYRLFQGHADFQTAKAACASLGGHLATFSSGAEADVASKIILPHKRTIWFGLEPRGRGHVWVTGEPIEFTRWHRGVRGQPNLAHGHLTPDGFWWCSTGLHTRWFLCEWDRAPE